MRRVIFVWLAQLGFERLSRSAGSAEPHAFIALGAGGWRLMGVDGCAAALGLSVGQSLADARLAAPNLVALPYDPDADNRLLAQLARFCGRFSPCVALAPAAGGAGGLYLDSIGVAHLFGGEAGHLGAIKAGLARHGFGARLGLADTPRAAFALARYGGDGALAAPGAGLGALADLPVAAIAGAAAENLRALGLKRVGDLVRLPRAGLARRFGQDLIDALDAAAGSRADPADPLPPRKIFCALARFAEPILLLDQITAVVADLAADLAARLDAEASGARRLALHLYRSDGECVRLGCGAGQPQTRADRIARLVCERLSARAERLDLGFGLEAISLAAPVVERLRSAVQDLDPNAAARAAAASAKADLLDRISARLGADAVRRLAPRDSHMPERAVRPVAAAVAAPFPPAGPRPLFLLNPAEPIAVIAQAPDGAPRRFRWRRVFHRVVHAAGPERIAAEWWRAAAPTRDYYHVETAEGRRFWLYRDGLMGVEAEAPDWFMHGAFA